MADLGPLIRLHKYELDEKRRVLAELYSELGLIERARERMEQEFLKEKAASEADISMKMTFQAYAETIARRREEMEKMERDLAIKIERAKESMIETFSEMKKYEMTEAERKRLEEEERRLKEGRLMDEIGLEGFRRRQTDQ